MATFTAFVWPPLIFPLPTPTGKIGGTFAIGARPPTVLPLPLTARTSKTATPAAPPMPSMVAPTPLRSGSVTFTPAALAVAAQNPTNIVPPQTTQNQIYSLFRIVNGTDSAALQNPGPITSPPPPVNPNGQ